MAKKVKTKEQKRWYKNYKAFLRLTHKKPQYIYLGEKIDKPSIILSNHVGTIAPLALELYWDVPFRFWGAGEMNDSFKSMYKYQSRVYFHEKKKMPLFLARLYCLLATPLTWWFYKGLDLISTYKDARFKRTLTQSIETLKNGKSLVIFPEMSINGYTDELKGFYAGFVVLCRLCLKEGIDVPIFPAYYKKKENVYVFGKKIDFSDLLKQGLGRDEIAQYICDKANELKDIDLSDKIITKSKKQQKKPK